MKQCYAQLSRLEASCFVVMLNVMRLLVVCISDDVILSQFKHSRKCDGELFEKACRVSAEARCS